MALSAKVMCQKLNTRSSCITSWKKLPGVASIVNIFQLFKGFSDDLLNGGH